MNYTYAETPIGRVLIAGNDEAIHRIHIVATEPAPEWRASREGIVGEACRQLDEYFRGTRKEFDLPLALQGTPFQKAVWHRLTEIPYGETISYAELAQRVGNPKACRAVGTANGANPLPIVIPCHRVIATGGGLGGYAGGLPMKRQLLDLELGGSGNLVGTAPLHRTPRLPQNAQQLLNLG